MDRGRTGYPIHFQYRNYMIPKQHRFHGPNSLNFVYRKGKSVRGDCMSLRFAGSRGDDYRLAVVVSKKVSKSAVVRNRIRRRFYEIVRVYRKEADAAWPLDLVISVFEERTATMPPEELKAQVLKLLQKSGL